MSAAAETTFASGTPTVSTFRAATAASARRASSCLLTAPAWVSPRLSERSRSLKEVHGPTETRGKCQTRGQKKPASLLGVYQIGTSARTSPTCAATASASTRRAATAVCATTASRPPLIRACAWVSGRESPPSARRRPAVTPFLWSFPCRHRRVRQAAVRERHLQKHGGLLQLPVLPRLRADAQQRLHG